MQTKILITVEGGIVQCVTSNSADIVVAIVDYDMHNSDEPVLIQVGPPDLIVKDMAQAFETRNKTFKLDKYERLARLKLHSAKFL